MSSLLRALILPGLAVFAAAPAAAEAPLCREDTFEGTAYTVCTIDLARDDLRIFLGNESGKPFRTFDALAADLAVRKFELVLAINGGMYHGDFSPVGLHVENGKELAGANTRDVQAKPVPNFYKKPNAVFYVGGGKAGVMETAEYLSEKPPADYATQSGPALVLRGVIHPAFIVGSADRTQRNGVGVSGGNVVYLAISEDNVNFHDFARFFRDHLGAADALFLDGGSAPGLYDPATERNDPPSHGGYGPIIAVVRPNP